MLAVPLRVLDKPRPEQPGTSSRRFSPAFLEAGSGQGFEAGVHALLDHVRRPNL